jgi:hypothetical protein
VHEYGSLPRARQDGLLEEAVGEELLLYDRESHTAHCLSPIAASVWRHCDGKRDIAELARLAAASENLVADVLHELREKDLLDAEPQLMQNTISGISRREAIGRAARYGAAATAGSLIVSATAATPAMASSSEEREEKEEKEKGTGCCQCVNPKGVNCKCSIKRTVKECSEFCEGLNECKGGTNMLFGIKCSPNGLTCS